MIPVIEALRCRLKRLTSRGACPGPPSKPPATTQYGSSALPGRFGFSHETAATGAGGPAVATLREDPRDNLRVPDEPVFNDHIVSRGLQRNFARDGHRIAAIDVRTGAVIDPDRSTKSNFAEPDFLTYRDVDGNPVREVDHAFTRIERSVLNLIREVTPATYNPERHHRPIVQLMSVHLVRSRALLASKLRLLHESSEDLGRELATSPATREKVRRALGRYPYPGEVEDWARRWTAHGIESGAHLIENLPEQQRTIADLLARYPIQIVESPAHLPGFALGDVPAVHASLERQLFGFRDRLAVGDADWASIPLARRTMAVFSAGGQGHRVVTTAKLIHRLNLLTVRSCEREVACHPDDIVSLQRLIRRPERFVTVGQLVGR